jgi:hypothetical protein
MPLAAPAATADHSNMEQWFAADHAAQDIRAIEVAGASPSAMASDPVVPRATDDNAEICANTEQRQSSELQYATPSAASADTQVIEQQTFQAEPPLSTIELQQDNSPTPNLVAARDLDKDTDTGPPAMETRVVSKP